MVTFALDTSFPRNTSLRPRDKDGSEGEAAACSGFLGTLVTLMPDTVTLFPSSIGLFSFHWYQVPFPPSTPFIPLTVFEPLHPFRFFRAWRQSFAIEVSDLYFSSPLSSLFDDWASTIF